MGLRWLVLLVAVAAVLDISQALFTAFKKNHDNNFKRYLSGVREKQAAMKKRHMGEDYTYCPLWDCYNHGDYYYDYEYGSGNSGSSETSESSEYGSGDYGSSYEDIMDFVEMYQEARECMVDLSKSGALCDCSVDDLYWSGMFEEEQLSPNNDTGCWECLGKLPDMFNPDALHFSCDAEAKITEAETCFNGVSDQSCLTKAMGGIEMLPKTVFDGIRTEVAGCPIHDVVMDCMGFNQENYRDPYTSCLMGSTMENAAGTCITDWLQKLPICKDKVPKEILPEIAASCKEGGRMMCAPLTKAIDMKQKCCNGGDPAESAPAARKLARMIEKMLKKEGY